MIPKLTDYEQKISTACRNHHLLQNRYKGTPTYKRQGALHVPLRVLSFKRSTAGAFSVSCRVLIQKCMTIDNLYIVLDLVLFRDKKIQATPTKQDLSIS